MKNLLFLYFSCVLLIIFTVDWLQFVGLLGLSLGYMAMRIENFRLRYGMSKPKEITEEFLRRY